MEGREGTGWEIVSAKEKHRGSNHRSENVLVGQREFEMYRPKVETFTWTELRVSSRASAIK